MFVSFFWLVESVACKLHCIEVVFRCFRDIIALKFLKLFVMNSSNPVIVGSIQHFLKDCKNARCIVLRWLFDAPRITLLPFSAAPRNPPHKDSLTAATKHLASIFLKINRWKLGTKPGGTPCFHAARGRARSPCWRLFCSPAFCHTLPECQVLF